MEECIDPFLKCSWPQGYIFVASLHFEYAAKSELLHLCGSLEALFIQRMICRFYDRIKNLGDYFSF